MPERGGWGSPEYRVPHEWLGLQEMMVFGQGAERRHEWWRVAVAPHLIQSFLLWHQSLLSSEDETIRWFAGQMQKSFEFENLDRAEYYDDEGFWVPLGLEWVERELGQILYLHGTQTTISLDMLRDLGIEVNINSLSELEAWVKRLRQAKPHSFYAANGPLNRKVSARDLDKAYGVWFKQILNWYHWDWFSRTTNLPLGIIFDEPVAGIPRSINFGSFSLELFFDQVYLPGWVRDPKYMPLFWDYFGEKYEAVADESLTGPVRAKIAQLMTGREVIADLCSGEGRMGAGLFGKTIYGVDISHWMGVVSGSAGEIATQADAVELPFRSNFFDGVTEVFGQHWIYDFPGQLVSVKRVLKPGGIFAYNLRRAEPDWLGKFTELHIQAGLPITHHEIVEVDRKFEIYRSPIVVATKPLE